MMMPRARRVDPAQTRWYHCVTRGGRRALLLSEDPLACKQWIDQRLNELAGILAVSVGGFSVMDNQSSSNTPAASSATANPPSRPQSSDDPPPITRHPPPIARHPFATTPAHPPQPCSPYTTVSCGSIPPRGSSAASTPGSPPSVRHPAPCARHRRLSWCPIQSGP
jgi:hypothetical protein